MPRIKKPTTKTDHQQCIKEWLASLEKNFLDGDEPVHCCMRFFVRNLVFVSGLGKGFHPNDFFQHIDMWLLGLRDKRYPYYSCMISSLYSARSPQWLLAMGRLEIVITIKQWLYASDVYYRIEGLEVTKEETSKLEAIHAKVSPLVKQYLEDMQQYLTKNSSAILAKYRGRSHFHESCIRKAWVEHCPKQYLADTERREKKKREGLESEVVDPNIRTILNIVRDAFDTLVFHIKGRCINHLMDVLDLCINYPSGDCLLTPEYWVEPSPLEQVKVIHSLVTEKELYRKHLPNADEESIERCRSVVSDIIRKVQCSAKKRFAKELEKQIASYKKRESVAARANASQLGLMANPEVKASEPGETDKKQLQGSRKAVSWSDPK